MMGSLDITLGVPWCSGLPCLISPFSGLDHVHGLCKLYPPDKKRKDLPTTWCLFGIARCNSYTPGNR